MGPMSGQEKLMVLHSRPVWLELTETWILDQITSLPAGVRSAVVCDRLKNQDQLAGVQVYQLAAREAGRGWRSRLSGLFVRSQRASEVSAIADRISADVLHSHFADVGWMDSPAAWRASIPHVVSVYGYDVTQLPHESVRWRKRLRKLFASTAAVLCEGSAMADTVRRLGCAPDRLRVHHLGIRVGDFPFSPRHWKPGEPLRILVAGSFREKKGIPYAIEAASRLNAAVPVQLTVIGDSDRVQDAGEKARILDCVAAGGFGHPVRMLGFQPHARLVEEAMGHHVFISSSVRADNGDREGGVPVTIIEMAATGMPVVSTRHCDVPEVIRHGQTGLLAEERDVEGLLVQLRRLMEQPEEWVRLVTSAREHIEQQYNAGVQAIRLAGLYSDLARPRTTHRA
jgi:colanic acid/amylovoran biosynthesis glycosyltransferase